MKIMENFKFKKIIAAMAVGSAVIFGGNIFDNAAIAAGAEVNVNVKVKGAVNWDKGAESDITAVGISVKDPRGMAMAREAAIMAAQRNLLGTVQGLQIDSDTTMRDFLIESDFVHRKISGIIRGGQIVEEYPTEDGGYYVKMRIPIYGADSIASAIVPEISPENKKPFETVDKPAIKPAEVREIQSNEYSGVVVDASGLGLQPTFSPVIFDTNGRAIYGVENLDPDKIIENGMVGYSNSLDNEITVERAGTQPLIVNAVKVNEANTSANKVNVIVSVEDADKILLANEKSHMLEKCAVVFVR